jgi:hypothetical protein
MNWILLNIPLGVVLVIFTVGLPLWVMLRFPDDDTREPIALSPRLAQAGARRQVSPDSTRLTAPAGTAVVPPTVTRFFTGLATECK